MIIVRVRGGLGNQLFQYATGRHLAHINKSELVLDLSWYSNIPSSDTRRSYELHNYQTQTRTITHAENIICSILNNRKLKKLPFLKHYIHKFKEKSFIFDQSVLSLNNNVYLDGYWQSPLYFNSIASIIVKELTPITPPGPKDSELITIIKKRICIGVHVRRGDYVSNRNASAMHGSCSAEYYHKAAEIVSSKIPSPHFIVFSDDIEWAEHNITFPGTVTYATHNDKDNAFQDLRLMSLCNHQIIANSTFSWWAAWLNQKNDKIIISPKQWFTENSIKTDTLIPNTWIRI